MQKNEQQTQKRYMLGSVPKLFTMGYYYRQKKSEKTMLNLPFMFYLDGKMDAKRLEASIQRVIAEEPVLRSYLEEENGEFYMVEKEKQDFILQVHKAEGKDKEEKIQYAKAYCDKMVLEPLPLFDSEKPVFLLELLEIEEDYHVMIFIIYHTFADLSSAVLLADSILGYYKDDNYKRKTGIFFSEIMEKEMNFQAAEEKDEIDYWNRQLDSFEHTSLIHDETFGEEEGLTENNTEILLDTNILESLAKANQTSLYNVLAMMIQMGIAKANDQTDTLIKYAIANRIEPNMQYSFGCLTRALYTRYEFQENESVQSLYKNFRRKMGEGHLNRHVAGKLPGNESPYLITNQDISALGTLPDFDGKEIVFEMRENAKIRNNIGVFTIPDGEHWIIRIGAELDKFSILSKRILDSILLAQAFLKEYPDGKIGDYLRNDITLDTLDKLKETEPFEVVEI